MTYTRTIGLVLTVLNHFHLFPTLRWLKAPREGRGVTYEDVISGPFHGMNQGQISCPQISQRNADKRSGLKTR